MKSLLALMLGINLYSSELILIATGASSDQLNGLSKKYQQPLIIDGNQVYLVPSDCRLERYFGGASQGALKLVQSPIQAGPIPMTQEVFEAKESTQIIQKLEQEKIVAIAEAKVSRAFLEDKEGRGFGGASQVPLDFRFEKIEVLKESAPKAAVEIKNTSVLVHNVPKCEILNDGSGYRIESENPPSLYVNGSLEKLADRTVHYR